MNATHGAHLGALSAGYALGIIYNCQIIHKGDCSLGAFTGAKTATDTAVVAVFSRKSTLVVIGAGNGDAFFFVDKSDYFVGASTRA